MAGSAPFATEQFTRAGQALLQGFFGAVSERIDPRVADQFRLLGAQTSKLAELQADYSRRHLSLWQSALARGAGRGAGDLGQPERGDRRFASAEWRDNPWFDYLRRSYLLNARYLSDCIEALDVEPFAKDRLRFTARQWIDAMSPANFAATNPDAIKLALETKGESLSQGIRNLIEDVHKGRISTTDEKAFELGRDLAVTEGAVVFENELIQLIQYAPRSAQIHERPLLIVPPCINKFYVLDLQPENSFVRYVLEQGHAVFMVSWRNVTEELGHLSWDDYLEKGVLRAIEIVREIAKAERINALGYCVGGTMLGAALAVLAARGEQKVESATFLASMLDFSDTGDIGLFVDEASIATREAAIGKGGVMPGQELAFVFSALRANDLVWSYVVSNYLKGNSPDAFDLLHWNADSTNLPGPMYCYYVRHMYLENALRDPGALTMLGVPVDLGRIRVPAYVVATKEDHIVPWRTAYRTAQLLQGETRFVVGASGHIAGVINPAAKNRRSYWIGENGHQDSEAWLRAATEKPGSWWTDWSAWLARYGGEKVKARKKPGNAKYKPIEPAPGRYVKYRVA